MQQLLQSIRTFAFEDEGSQVVEYALIIALVSIALALVLNSAVTGLGSTFSDLADRVTNCFASTSGTC